MIYTKEELNFIQEQGFRTRFKVLLNELARESLNFTEFKVYWRNGVLFYKVRVIENSLLNKYFLKESI